MENKRKRIKVNIYIYIIVHQIIWWIWKTRDYYINHNHNIAHKEKDLT